MLLKIIHLSKCRELIVRLVACVFQLLEFRNSLFHSGDFQVDDAALQAAQQTMLAFLRGMKSLSTQEQQSVVQAINKITEVCD